MRTQGGQPAQKGSGRTMPPTAWAVAWDTGCEWKTLVDQRRGQGVCCLSTVLHSGPEVGDLLGTR